MTIDARVMPSCFLGERCSAAVDALEISAAVTVCLRLRSLEVKVSRKIGCFRCFAMEILLHHHGIFREATTLALHACTERFNASVKVCDAFIT